MTNRGEIYVQRENNDWIQQASDAKDVGVGSDGSVWYLTAYGEPAEIPRLNETIYMTNAEQTSIVSSDYEASNPINRFIP